MPKIDDLIQKANLHPILFDVGASGEPHAIWNPISGQAIYVGFDPDEREMYEMTDGKFYRNITVNKAVTDENGDETIHFYLTKSPFCSSTLPPNKKILSQYLYADLFTVERETTVPATTLNKTLEKIGLPHIDWLKLDSQGLDLRLLKSLDQAVFDQLLAVDIEPGLTEFYVGENLFADLHPYLTSNGFWLSDIVVKGSVKMRPDNFTTMESSSEKRNALQSRMKQTPGWVEARYLRDLSHITSKEQHILLWVFSVLDQQVGFALDVASQYRECFGEDDIYLDMINLSRGMQRLNLYQRFSDQIRHLLPVSFKNRIKTMLR